MDHILVADCEVYQGQYVATEYWGSTAVISSSETPSEAYNRAVEQGIKEPVLIYVPTVDESSSF